MKIEKYSSCRTNRAGLVIASLDVFGITNTVFSTMFRFGVIAETLSNLDTTTTGECARVPWWPGPPVPIDCGQQGENNNDFFFYYSCCVPHLRDSKGKLLGHGDFWHFSVCRPSPAQLLPPNWGMGELHRRIRVMTPAPQVTEQDDQGDQWLQLPSCLTEGHKYGSEVSNQEANCSTMVSKTKSHSTAQKLNDNRDHLGLTHIACRTPVGSSLGSALRCPHSCYWYDRKSARAAGCPAHMTQNNGSNQTMVTNCPLQSRSLSKGQIILGKGKRGDNNRGIPVPQHLICKQIPRRQWEDTAWKVKTIAMRNGLVLRIRH